MRGEYSVGSGVFITIRSDIAEMGIVILAAEWAHAHRIGIGKRIGASIIVLSLAAASPIYAHKRPPASVKARRRDKWIVRSTDELGGGL